MNWRAGVIFFFLAVGLLVSPLRAEPPPWSHEGLTTAPVPGHPGLESLSDAQYALKKEFHSLDDKFHARPVMSRGAALRMVNEFKFSPPEETQCIGLRSKDGGTSKAARIHVPSNFRASLRFDATTVARQATSLNIGFGPEGSLAIFRLATYEPSLFKNGSLFLRSTTTPGLTLSVRRARVAGRGYLFRIDNDITETTTYCF